MGLNRPKNFTQCSKIIFPQLYGKYNRPKVISSPKSLMSPPLWSENHSRIIGLKIITIRKKTLEMPKIRRQKCFN